MGHARLGQKRLLRLCALVQSCEIWHVSSVPSQKITGASSHKLLQGLGCWPGEHLVAKHPLKSRTAVQEEYLLEDVCALALALCHGLRRGLAWHRLELGIAESKAQQGDGKAVDEEQGG